MDNPTTKQIQKTLEASLNEQITVVRSTANGLDKIHGTLAKVDFPEGLHMSQEIEMGGAKIDSATFINFAGRKSGIVAIIGKVKYLNEQIPVPYTPFDVSTEEGREALSKLRKKCFGEDSK